MKRNSETMRCTKNRVDGVVDLDTALSMTGQGKFNMQLVFVAGGSMTAITMDNLGLSYVLPNISCEMDLSVANRGLLPAAMLLGTVLTGYVWGFASDTFGRRKVLLPSIAMGWVMSFSASLSPVFWLAVTMRFLTGAIAATMASTIFTYVVEFLPPEKRVSYVSRCSIFIGIGYCLMPVTAWLILPLTWSFDLGFVVLSSWRILCLLNGSYIILVFLGMLSLPESPKYLLSVDKHQEALDVLREVFSRNTGRPPSEYPVREIRKTIEDERTTKIMVSGDFSVSTIFKGMRDQIAPIFGRKYISTTILACVLQFWIYCSINGVYFWLPELQNRLTVYNEANPNATVIICDVINVKLNTTSNVVCQSAIDATAYVSSLVLGLSLCVGFTLVGAVVNVVGKRTLLVVIQFLGGLSCFGLYWATNAASFTAFVAGYTVHYCIANVVFNAVLSDLYPTYLRSAALCITLTIGRIGASMAGITTGIIIEYDCVATIFSLGVISIGVGLLSFGLPSSAKTISTIT